MKGGNIRKEMPEIKVTGSGNKNKILLFE